MTDAVMAAPEQSPQQALAPVDGQPEVLQLSLPITVVLVGDAAGAVQMLKQRCYRQPMCHARAEQLEINLQTPAHRPPSPKHQQPPRCRPRRQRPVRPHAAADSLALEHMDLAEKIAGNFARRTVHPKEDLLQLAMIGLIKAARRYDPSRGPFRPYGRTYANGEITHFLRDNGFLLKVPPTWRELHARGQRLLTSGVAVGEMLERLGISREQWIQIVDACSVRVVAFPVD
ncbi:RNA polymerase subunit sigma-70 [Synechococcus sp. HJ21-Hayes]|uniref:sigma-70 family RNA polymerase sigma factor n=1 Tax=unclassified Synechococcus TaxID=2626047 RepID=UPI0020CC424C|nr:MULTISPECIES: sigma factor [unclassified Synechococcus]MCP9831436.1 RNA polymerase subunit sigma-70 [Synechococcus sp. JJ3a-Johnson]MCP9851673.1 RNA polymerase subunit sigma-70 [Synechococcus sp. HJ21-Hayes]